MEAITEAVTETTQRERMLALAYELPLEDLDVSNWHLMQNDAIWPWFKRLREEDPVHYHADSRYGPFWSITRFDDIKDVDQNHKSFSSASGIGILDIPEDDVSQPFTSFISMDQPKHDVQRKAVSPVVAPRNLAEMESVIRSRAAAILDSLPIGETFNWVQRVSIELTTQMLATLFDFPFEDRRKLTHWSDVATMPGFSREERTQEMQNCLATFSELWQQRVDQPPNFDLISLLIHGDGTRNMIQRPTEFLGNLLLLIVGGNDTTRNSISGGVLALNTFPDEYDKLRADHSLIPNMVAEIIRWQTPLAFMRRTALEDVELQGKQIRKGDKVVMWYASGNRDETKFTEPDRLIIDRANARNHISFGFGIHRCMGNRLAEMQLRVLWQEIMQRFEHVEIVGDVKRVKSNFIRGYSDLPVRLHPKT